MNLKLIHKIITLALTISAVNSVIAQENPISRTDSIEREKDDYFENLEKNKDSNGFNKIIHKYFYRSPRSKAGENISATTAGNRKPFSEAEGKIIRNIHIDTKKPFGYSLTDSTRTPQKFYEKTGNSLHIKTKEFVVRNYFLFKEGEPYDSLKILETERLLRNEHFTRRVLIEYEINENNPNSVDLFVKTIDAWSIIPTGTISGSRVGLRLRDKNFFGLGHDFEISHRQNLKEGKNRFHIRYIVPNIQNTFITAGAGYASNEYNEYTKSVFAQRRFFSPLTRWAGGAYFGQTAFMDSIQTQENFYHQEFRYNLQDYWAGYSFRLFKEGTESSSNFNNLIISARYFRMDYTDKLPPELDTAGFYNDEEYYLIGFGLTKRGFVQDRYIRYYDIVEDIGVGATYGVTGGVQRKNGKSRFYFNGKIKRGDYYKFGYLGFDFGYGTFFNNGKSEQSVFSLSGLYFTNLKDWGEWKFRGFISSDLVAGQNRVNSRGDRLTLNDDSATGIAGFDSWELIGTKKWVNNILIQSYSPYEVWGFRFSPFFSASTGLISDSGVGLFSSKAYSKVELGILFTNDYLAFSQFRISFAWYNTIPGRGENIFKTNVFGSSDYRLIDFEFGKPGLIEYNPKLPR